MQEYPNDTTSAVQRGPLTSLAILFVFIVCGLFVGNFLGMAFVWLFLGGNPTDFMATFQGVLNGTSDHPQAQTALLILQAVAAACAFIIAPLAYLRVVEGRTIKSLNPGVPLWLIPALLTIFLVIAFMPFNAVFIEWNRNIDLPAVFDRWEEWAKAKETDLAELTRRITEFKTVPQLLFGLVVIALIPAIGEELVFRGLVQPKVFRLTGNVHAAVWITGFIFSFIHMQFYGLIPRMLLGVVFGYLYAWSGNLLYPIIGHFANNGFTLIMFYFYQQKAVPIDIEDTASVPLTFSISALVLTALLVMILKTQFSRFRPADR
jgi:membrane protease YdiL (CAAX protease family)